MESSEGLYSEKSEIHESEEDNVIIKDGQKKSQKKSPLKIRKEMTFEKNQDE